MSVCACLCLCVRVCGLHFRLTGVGPPSSPGLKHGGKSISGGDVFEFGRSFEMTNVLLVQSPLVGVPRSLPIVNRLHHSVVIGRMAPVDPMDERGEPEHVLFLMDVLPKRATSFSSLVSLIAGQTIPANYRCKRLSQRGFLDGAHVCRSCSLPGAEPMELVDEARRFQGAYHDGEPTINLYSSNCVGFATYVIL